MGGKEKPWGRGWGDLTEGFLRYRFGGFYLEGFIHGGAYFRNFTVACVSGLPKGLGERRF